MADAFLQSELTPAAADNADVHIIPVPLESTVSYGAGTADGPRAILEASQQLESLPSKTDGHLPRLHTTAPVDTDGDIEDVLQRAAHCVSEALRLKAMPILLGGEHTVTYAAAQALEPHGQGEIGIVQFDAHADLRDQYEDAPWSHACVMRRILDLGLPVFQIGVRSLAEEERRVRQQQQLSHVDAREVWRNGVEAVALPDNFPRNLYVTFDVDAFDASLMPATGTPEPGGLCWWSAVTILERLMVGRLLVGADVVELAPVPSLHHCDYTAAKLVSVLIQLGMKIPTPGNAGSICGITVLE